MKTDVELEITGDALPFSARAVSGISITYAVDQIPTAVLSLNAPMLQEDAPDFLCNPQNYKSRDKDTIITLRTKTGCIRFRGYFDGLQISQSVGGVAYAAIIRNRFHRLTDVYPYTPGIMPSSFKLFGAVEQFKTEQGNEEILYAAFNIAKDIAVDTSKSMGEFVLEYFKALLKTQFDYANTTHAEDKIENLFKIMKDTAYNKNIEISQELLDLVNVDYIKDCIVPAYQCAENLVGLTLGSQTDLWEMMGSVFGFMGCCMVVGNDQLFILPRAGFLKMDHAVPREIQRSSEPNTANPADYNGFTVTDSGRNNVKYCYVAIDSSQIPGSPMVSLLPVCTRLMGVYPKEGKEDPELQDDGASGVLIETVSPFWLRGTIYQTTSNPDLHAAISGGEGYCDQAIEDNEKVTEKLTEAIDDAEARSEKDQEILDAFAKLKFLEAKYQDRTGSFTCVFTPKWVPGTTGSLYTRLPGLFTQFYVTSVRHTIQVNSPNTGVATTDVQFASSRFGKEGQIPGVESDDLFRYSKDKMIDMQKAFIFDIGA